MDFIKKYAMIIVLVLVVIFFTIMTQGKMLLPQNISNLISQNAYVFILATGMLLCILTGGNIDLSVGSVVCFVGAVGAELMMTQFLPKYLFTVMCQFFQAFYLTNQDFSSFICQLVFLPAAVFIHGFQNDPALITKRIQCTIQCSCCKPHPPAGQFFCLLHDPVSVARPVQ